MKLFAFVASTAVTSRRVQEPAPGFVNEQGGYWADQPTHPQAPQESFQVHKPNVQKPQCCEGYTWISSTNDPVWLSKSGEHHDKPVYKGRDESGVERVLFWAFDNTAGSPPVYALSGHWYLSSSIDDRATAITESQESYGLRYCPQDYQSIPYTNDMDFKCGQGRQQQQQQQHRQCCEYYEWTPRLPVGRTDKVGMYYTGKQVNGKRIYEGDDNGTTNVMFYQPALPGSSSGGWYVGTSVDDPSPFLHSANVPNGLNSCPDQRNLGWDKMECKSPPKETCDDAKALRHQNMFITTGSPAPPFTEFTFCHIQNIMNQLVINQLNDLVKMFDNTSKPWLMRTAFPDAVNAWSAMTRKDQKGEDNCGFWNDFRFGETGFVMTCDNFCDDIKKIGKPEDFKNVLEEFLALVDSKFDKGTYQILLLKILDFTSIIFFR